MSPSDTLSKGKRASTDAKSGSVTTQRRRLKVGIGYFDRPVVPDDFGESVQLRVVDEKARVNRAGIRHYPEPKTSRSAAVGHRLADIDDLGPADRAVAGNVGLDPGPDARRLPAFRRGNQGHLAAWERH